MAILQMKRLTLAVIRSQKEALLKELIRHGCLEVAEIDGLVKESEIASLVKSEDSDLMKYRQAYSSLQHGIDLLNRYVPKKSPLLSSQPEISSEEFLDETGMWGAVQFARQIEENDGRIKRISAEESRQRCHRKSEAVGGSDDAAQYGRDGLCGSSPWYDPGTDLFGRSCRSC